MPTPTGLPKVGEVWERTARVYGMTPERIRIQKVKFVVLERTRGFYWAIRVQTEDGSRHIWTDASYWHHQGQLRYVGPAGPETKKKLGLG